jgi:Ni,Fe-hydrogenase III large subunit
MAYLLPIGPWHPVLDEPVVYKLEINRTQIQRVEIELGFNHRGVEGTLLRLPPHRLLSGVSRICGKCSFANSLAVALTLENLAGIEAPDRAQYLRCIMAELERAVSHLSNVARVLRMLGINLPAARLEEEAEGVRQLLAATGNRVYDTITLIGGAMRNLSLPLEFLSAAEKLRKNIYESVNQLLDNRQLARRTVGIGVINFEQAAEYSLVGPVARSCELPEDTRRLQPYAAYAGLQFRVINQRGGDVFSRLAVRLLEALESMNIVTQAVQNMPDGIVYDQTLPAIFPEDSEASISVETPRGELFCYAASDDKGKLNRLHLRPPTTMNLPALPLTLINQEVEDAAAILASLDYCWACGER